MPHMKILFSYVAPKKLVETPLNSFVYGEKNFLTSPPSDYAVQYNGIHHSRGECWL